MKKLSTRDIAMYGMLIALNVILTRYASIRIGGDGTEAVRIGFGGYPVIFAGIVFGPLAGGIIGAVGDLIGMMVSPMGAFMPHFTLVAALTGIIPGLAMLVFRDPKAKTNFAKLLFAIALGQIITSVFMTPYFMQKLFSIPMAVKVPERAIVQAFQIPLYAYITKIILQRLPLVWEAN